MYINRFCILYIIYKKRGASKINYVHNTIFFKFCWNKRVCVCVLYILLRTRARACVHVQYTHILRFKIYTQYNLFLLFSKSTKNVSKKKITNHQKTNEFRVSYPKEYKEMEDLLSTRSLLPTTSCYRDNKLKKTGRFFASFLYK